MYNNIKTYGCVPYRNGGNVMGHETRYTSYDENVNRRAVYAQWSEHAMHDGWQEGCHGLNHDIRWIEGPILNSYDEAYEYIKEHDSGWYDQLAVRYREVKLSDSKKIMEIKERLQKEIQKRKDYEAAHSVSTFKAEFVGCPDCGSKLKRTLLNSEKCPLCKTDLRGRTTLETLARYDANIEKYRKQIKDESKKILAKAEKNAVIKWLVKVEWHS